MKKWKESILISLGSIALSLSLIVWAKWGKKQIEHKPTLQEEVAFKIEERQLASAKNPFFSSENIQKFIKTLSKNKSFSNKNLLLTGNCIAEETVFYALKKGFTVTWLKWPVIAEEESPSSPISKKTTQAVVEENWKKEALENKKLIIIDFNEQFLTETNKDSIGKSCVFLIDSTVKVAEQKQWTDFFRLLIQKMNSGNFLWIKLHFEIDPFVERKNNSFFEKEWKKEVMALKNFDILQWSHANRASYRFLRLKEEKEVWEKAKQFQVLMQKN
jgi:hypothetical protein